MNKTEKPATLKDVAALAGVSVMTVSNAINRKGGLSEKTYEKVSRLPLLNSDSLFVEFDKKQDKDKVNEEYLEKVKENLYKEFVDKFANSQRLIKKSIMSATLSELPVFFNNISELQDFVYNCLHGCTNMAEKKGCLEIISSMIV